jgi:hypothetical protein
MIGSGLQSLLGGIYTHRKQGDLISVLLLCKNEKRMLKIPESALSRNGHCLVRCSNPEDGVESVNTVKSTSREEIFDIKRRPQALLSLSLPHLYKPCDMVGGGGVNMRRTHSDVINTTKMIMHMAASGFW